jgi:hypothetical protein
MKISKDHFIDSENAFVDQIRDAQAAALTSVNYGLLKPLNGEKSALDCNTSTNQSGKFKVTVSYCRAITAGGCRIEIIPGIHPELVSDNDSFYSSDAGKGSGYFAMISVDPYNREPFGPASAEEYPPRNKYSVSGYRLSLIPADEVNISSMGANHLAVARFIVRNGELVRDAEYIPPCATIAAHPGTKQIYNTLAERLNQIQEASAEIARKVYEGNQNTPLAQNVRKICEQGISHIASEFFMFRMLYRQQSPIYMANTVVQLAALINVNLSLLPVKEKEELTQYFSYWNEVSPGKFEELLGSVTNADYDHEDIYGFYQPLLAFLKLWAELLDKLKELKLIGQRNEKFDFGGRTMESPKEKGKGKFSIFD